MINITGVILAGGQGKRMAQSSSEPNTVTVEKGWISFLGIPMIEHVIKRLTPQVNEVIINANREVERYATLGHRVVQDSISGCAGPLAGLHAGMKAAKNSYVLTVPCDSPLLAMDLVNRLSIAMLENNADIAVAKTGEQAHPVFCLCSIDLLQHLEHYLQNGGRKFDAWYSTLNVVEVAFDDKPLAFANINTHKDLIQLESAAV
ncbi:molybdenum cofactor guanylyltransferase [mine drainage metagenome]|uniref:Molybdenum cofactor guanylyltransferase n=1 Tax=mine drainage metagenome TaxID=410659 RepID=A0A1J5SX17_9ZZZZ